MNPPEKPFEELSLIEMSKEIERMIDTDLKDAVEQRRALDVWTSVEPEQMDFDDEG